MGRIKLGLISLRGVRVVGSFGEVHAGAIKFGVFQIKRVNLDNQALAEQVRGIKFWGSGLRDQGGRGIRFGG